MKARTIALIVVAKATLMSGVASAQLGTAPLPQVAPTQNATGPLLEDTLQWIKEKIEAWEDPRDKGEFKKRFRTRELIINGCTINVLTGEYDNDPPYWGTSDKSVIRANYMPLHISLTPVDLADVDVARIVATPSAVVFQSVGSAALFHTAEFSTGVWDWELKKNPLMHATYVGRRKCDESSKSSDCHDFSYKNPDTTRGRERLRGEIMSGEIMRKVCISEYCRNGKANFWLDDIQDASLAIRLQAAFKHAVTLCQKARQERLQEEAAKPKKKELF